MRLADIKEEVVSKAKQTPLYRPFEKARSSLDQLAEARDKWADRSLSVRLQEQADGFSTLLFRTLASRQAPGMKSLLNVPATHDIPDYERQLAAFSAVMAAFRVDAASEMNRFSVSQTSALRSYLELAGISTYPSDERTPQRALSRSRPQLGDLPEFMFNPKSMMTGTLNIELAHELFHTASPLGGGLCLDGHVREILANRFAVEATHPVPWLIYSAETDAAGLIGGPFAVDEVMRISGRPMFGVTAPMGASPTGSIILQARGDLAQWGDPDRTRLTQSWEDLVLWSKPGKVDYFPPGLSWKPELIPTDSHGYVNLQTVEGLYYVFRSTDEIWSMFTESGIVESDDFEGLPSRTANFCPRDIPEIATEEGHLLIEGGQYLVIRMPRNVISLPQFNSHQTHQILAIKDEGGYLCQAWEQAAGKRKLNWGPLLPALDPQRHDHLVPFDNWWLATREWREIVFDFWAEIVADKFMRDLTAEEQKNKETLEDTKIEDIQNGIGGLGFVARTARK